MLVCTSRFWFNYRHIANTLAVYRSVKCLRRSHRARACTQLYMHHFRAVPLSLLLHCFLSPLGEMRWACACVRCAPARFETHDVRKHRQRTRVYTPMSRTNACSLTTFLARAGQVKRLGMPDSHIILMLADDMACNPRYARHATC